MSSWDSTCLSGQYKMLYSWLAGSPRCSERDRANVCPRFLHPRDPTEGRAWSQTISDHAGRETLQHTTSHFILCVCWQIEGLKAAELAIDRPSTKFLSFLRKNYGLHLHVKQVSLLHLPLIATHPSMISPDWCCVYIGKQFCGL